MPGIRVLVVDDSVVVRKVLCEALTADSTIEIAGTAADGSIALSKIPILKPDLITLDVEMPGMSGLETLAEIRKLHPKLPVIMFSTLTERGAAITLDALALGASDYVAKPSNTGSVEQTRLRIQTELVPKVKGLCLSLHRGLRAGIAPHVGPEAKASSVARPGRTGVIDIVAVGTSTGGPNALAEMLPGIPKAFPVPIVIVQHMPPLFTRLLAERLNKQCAIEIREGEEGAALKPGEAWIAPGDFHMTVVRTEGVTKLALQQEAPENSCRPAVDVLFRSVARLYGVSALGVVLTGMGSDGVKGSQTVKEFGGQVIVQDEASSVVWGMPGQVAGAGLAEGMYPLAGMAKEIDRRVKSGRLFTGREFLAQGAARETARNVEGVAAQGSEKAYRSK
jgi:two-component system, chemotaxis family, protein-glutamate methylesterase/glutaminase